MSKLKTLKCIRIFYSVRLIFVCIFLFSIAGAQKLPDRIRGYKVYQTKITVKNQSSDNSDAADSKAEKDVKVFVNVGEPEIDDISLTGLTIKLPAKINSSDQSGTIDFLTFKDFRVNGLAVNVEEYENSFEIKKNQTVILPKPITIFISTGQTLRGAFKEFNESNDEWTVTGTVFVFGRFKKAFAKFKRVVPVEVNLKIKNPLRSAVSLVEVKDPPDMRFSDNKF